MGGSTSKYQEGTADVWMQRADRGVLLLLTCTPTLTPSRQQGRAGSSGWAGRSLSSPLHPLLGVLRPDRETACTVRKLSCPGDDSPAWESHLQSSPLLPRPLLPLGAIQPIFPTARACNYFYLNLFRSLYNFNTCATTLAISVARALELL